MPPWGAFRPVRRLADTLVLRREGVSGRNARQGGRNSARAARRRIGRHVARCSASGVAVCPIVWVSRRSAGRRGTAEWLARRVRGAAVCTRVIDLDPQSATAEAARGIVLTTWRRGTLARWGPGEGPPQADATAGPGRRWAGLASKPHADVTSAGSHVLPRLPRPLAAGRPMAFKAGVPALPAHWGAVRGEGGRGLRVPRHAAAPRAAAARRPAGSSLTRPAVSLRASAPRAPQCILSLTRVGFALVSLSNRRLARRDAAPGLDRRMVPE